MSDTEETNGSEETNESGEKDSLLNRLYEKGEVVFNLFWDSGAPFPGAGHDLIYHLDGSYWFCDDNNEVEGPYESLAEALPSWPIGSATEMIECPAYSASGLVTMLDFSQLDLGQRIEINGEQWQVSKDGKLERVEGMEGTGGFGAGSG